MPRLRRTDGQRQELVRSIRSGLRLRVLPLMLQLYSALFCFCGLVTCFQKVKRPRNDLGSKHEGLLQGPEAVVKAVRELLEAALCGVRELSSGFEKDVPVVDLRLNLLDAARHRVHALVELIDRVVEVVVAVRAGFDVAVALPRVLVEEPLGLVAIELVGLEICP